MGALEEQARFLVAKYGTAAGPTGLTGTAAPALDLAALMIVLGLLIFAAVLFSLVRDWQQQRTTSRY